MANKSTTTFNDNKMNNYNKEDEIQLRTHRILNSLQFSSSLSELDQLQSRRSCSQCGKGRKYFCYNCLRPIDGHNPPILSDLPLDVFIIKHPTEKWSKSTAVHAAILCPKKVHLVTSPHIPQEVVDNPETTLLVFPSKNSITIDELFNDNNNNNNNNNNDNNEKESNLNSSISEKDTQSSNNFTNIKRVVFIDSSWNTANGIFQNPAIHCLQPIALKQYYTIFWRFQNLSRTFLATIEAIYYFCREFITAKNKYDHLGKLIPKNTTIETNNNNNNNNNNGNNNENDNLKKNIDNTSTTTNNQISQFQQDDELYYNGEVDDLLYYYVYLHRRIIQEYASGETFSPRVPKNYSIQSPHYNSDK